MGLFGIGGNKLSSHDDIVLKKHKEMLSTAGGLTLIGIGKYSDRYSDENSFLFTFKTWDNNIIYLRTNDNKYPDEDYFGLYYKGKQKIETDNFRNSYFLLRFSPYILNNLQLKINNSDNYSDSGWVGGDSQRNSLIELLSDADGCEIKMHRSIIIFKNQDNNIYDNLNMQQIYFNAMLRCLEELNNEYEIFMQDGWIKEFKRLNNINSLDPDMQYRMNILKRMEENIKTIYELSDENMKLKDEYYDTL